MNIHENIITNKKNLRIHKNIRKLFTNEEDELLLSLIKDEKTIDWFLISKKIIGRTARQCRDRYNNYLKPTVINEKWTLEEDTKLCQKVEKYGQKWATISQFFNGRTSNNIKNRWHKHLAKKNLRKINNEDKIKILTPDQ